MTPIIQQISSQIDNPLVLFGIFFILAIANLFFPPIPLESAILFGGVLAGTGRGSIIAIVMAATLGMSSGSMILFGLTRRYGYSFILKTPFRKAVAGPTYPKIARWFNRYGLWAVFLGKIIPGMSLGSVIFCGILRWKTSRATAAILGSNLLFLGTLGFTGRIIGANWSVAAEWLKRINFWAILIAVSLIAGIVLYSLFRRRNKVH
jgi:membrane protein DedA with SNARE-associated domain